MITISVQTDTESLAHHIIDGTDLYRRVNAAKFWDRCTAAQRLRLPEATRIEVHLGGEEWERLVDAVAEPWIQSWKHYAAIEKEGE